jgi:hypothetical protein
LPISIIKVLLDLLAERVRKRSGKRARKGVSLLAIKALFFGLSKVIRRSFSVVYGSK